MLDYAKTRLPDDGRITWKQADALALPFGDQSFDAVACQFGAMFFPDRVAGYKEARRVLKPGGHFIFNVWDRISENDFADVVTQALAEIFPDDPPRFMARTPHGYHDVDQIRADLKAAGFAERIGGHCGRPKQSVVRARCGDRLLPGHPAEKRDRGSRCVANGRGDNEGG